MPSYPLSGSENITVRATISSKYLTNNEKANWEKCHNAMITISEGPLLGTTWGPFTDSLYYSHNDGQICFQRPGSNTRAGSGLTFRPNDHPAERLKLEYTGTRDAQWEGHGYLTYNPTRAFPPSFAPNSQHSGGGTGQYSLGRPQQPPGGGDWRAPQGRDQGRSGGWH